MTRFAPGPAGHRSLALGLPRGLIFSLGPEMRPRSTPRPPAVAGALASPFSGGGRERPANTKLFVSLSRFTARDPGHQTERGRRKVIMQRGSGPGTIWGATEATWPPGEGRVAVLAPGGVDFRPSFTPSN